MSDHTLTNSGRIWEDWGNSRSKARQGVCVCVCLADAWNISAHAPVGGGSYPGHTPCAHFAARPKSVFCGSCPVVSAISQVVSSVADQLWTKSRLIRPGGEMRDIGKTMISSNSGGAMLPNQRSNVTSLRLPQVSNLGPNLADFRPTSAEFGPCLSDFGRLRSRVGRLRANFGRLRALFG